MINRTGLHRTLVIHYSRQAHCATTTVVHSSRPRTRSRHGAVQYLPQDAATYNRS